MSDKQRFTLSLTDAYTLFELDNKARRYTAGTHRFYRGHLSKFLRWCEEHSYTSLSDITSTVIKNYLVYLQEKGYADYTQHIQARVIRRFLRFCAEEKLIPEAPKVTLPKVDQDVLPSFSLEDVKKLLAACQSLRDRTMTLMLLDSGLRAREFVELDWQHVSLGPGGLCRQSHPKAFDALLHRTPEASRQQTAVGERQHRQTIDAIGVGAGTQALG